MAGIAAEVESLRNYLTDPKYTRIWLQHIPQKPKAGELAIRYQGDSVISETGYHYRIEREYQFVYYGATELDCIQAASELQRVINGTHAIPIEGTDRHMRIGMFGMSQPFRTEGGEVYGVIGVLQAVVREAREFEEVQKIGEFSAEVKPRSQVSGEETGDDFEIK